MYLSLGILISTDLRNNEEEKKNEIIMYFETELMKKVAADISNSIQIDEQMSLLRKCA